MITGAVNAQLEACIPLIAKDASGQQHPIKAIIDTGFSGFLALPRDLIAAWGLMWLFEEEAMLADGNVRVLDVYAGTIIWGNQSRAIRIIAIDSGLLVGMKLLEGSDFHMRVTIGGPVTINAVP